MKSTCILPSLSDILNPLPQQDYKSYQQRNLSNARLKVSNLLLSKNDIVYEEEPVKAKRKRASSSQLNILNRVFEQTFFPSTELRIELGRQLGMSPRTVQIWFQNKRQSLRMKERASYNHLIRSPPISPSSNHTYSFNNANHQTKSVYNTLPPLKLSQASTIFPLTPSSSAQPSPTSFDHLM
ncbi:uncharacterized protein BX663DRAFT_493970 [Cokeromyces recurvatus]|uniref:uncharacterized protein n=1 Tax=Cokeromyces recurvatus TaxID=90255 RepID=UPI002220E864|nr:uncharacterized protein BX663DRAFT_493970 [Cokeromyces recurvatus]KAI7906840.1 hypothetical protein BX663DRAFT_493970 [Cokeromyces recurvatus]